MNELEIERKTVIDENKKLAALVEEYGGHIINQEELEKQNDELKRYLQEEIEQNRQLSEQNEKFQQIVESLEEKILTESQKYQNKQKKLSRDMAMEKRKGLEQQKHIEDLRRQLKNVQNEQVVNMKKKSKPIVRPNSSHPNSYQSSQPIKPVKEDVNVPLQVHDVHTEEIKSKNQQLEKELR